jgi:Carboxypeptidase regulatory-like domain
MFKSALLPRNGFTLLLLFITLLLGCQKNNPFPDPGTDPRVDDGVKVAASISGFVINENNVPVAGATVTSGGVTTTTNRYGAFRFNNIQISRDNGYVTVTKSGYYKGSRSFLTTAGRNHYVKIKLIPKNIVGNINGGSGGSLTLPGGGKLTLPAAGVVTTGGAAYSGQVDVAMVWLDPTSQDLSLRMPGDLRGITTGGQQRSLQTFGMMGVELTGSGGQELKIATGKKATLNFPIPAALSGQAPATINLWHFDEIAGRWKEEGSATKTGNEYIADVTHFSFWNCDVPTFNVILSMRIVNAAGQPMNNMAVKISRTSSSQAAYGWTDSTGFVSGYVPSNEPLVLQLLDYCWTPVFSQNIGPFSSNTDLGVITANIPAISTVNITGTVTKCNNANVTNGGVAIFFNNGVYYGAVNNGAFSVNIVNCSGLSNNYSIIATDNDALQESFPVTVSGASGTLNAGTIQACGNSSQQYIEFIVDGAPYSFVSPADSVVGYSTGQTPPPPYSHRLTVNGTRSSGVGSLYSAFFNVASNATPGTGLLMSIAVNLPGFASQQIITPASPPVTLTTFGAPISGYIEGDFAIVMASAGGGPNKNVSCRFRVRRTQ